ncbi:MAG: pre-peptidase C-terminal domain-containing protein [Myxococcales bacterium]|nr:pre-peptidase C-terminal domain-containing protein [Myxococcales bacterium]
MTHRFMVAMVAASVAATMLGALQGCGPQMMTNDVTNPDASGDGGADTGADTAAPQPRVCDPANVVDLAMAGMRMGTTTRYTGTTANAATNQMIAVPTGCLQGGMAVRQVAHTYRVQNMGFLRVSTANMGTPPGMDGHDTVVWVQDRCDTRGTMSLGCNDDTGQGVTASTLVSNRLVMPGQMLTIVVATFQGMSAGVAAPYELSIEEVPPLAMGAECNPSGTNLCNTGLSCVGSGQVGRCVANGSLGAACRDMNMCDPMLECIEVGTDAFRCLRRATAGGLCDGVTLCPDDSACIPDGMMPGNSLGGRCRANGSEGGICGGNTMVSCAMGLVCTGDDMRVGTCVRDMIAMGMPCDPTGFTTRCAMGTTCARAAMGYTCQVNGSAAGSACTDMMPRCSGMGLACSAMTGAGTCRSTAMAGGMCDPRFGSISCAGMEACSSNGDGAGVCRAFVAEGAGMNNTPMMAEAARPLPLVIRGSLEAGDVDCFNVTLPAGSGIVAQMSDGAGGCPAMADSELFLLDSMGRTISTNDDAFNLCSYLDTRDNAFTRMLAAGNYTVCVRNYMTGMFPNYTLSVNAVAPRM